MSHDSPFAGPDSRNNYQRVSMDALSLTKNAHTDTYDAMAFSKSTFSDDKHLSKMVVTFLKDSRDNKESHDFASHTVNLSRETEKVASKFNNFIKHVMATKRGLPGTKESNQIHFQEQQMSKLMSVSRLDKRRREEEYFVFAKKLRHCKLFLDMLKGVGELKEAEKKRKRSKSATYGVETSEKKNRTRVFSLRDDNGEESECTYQEENSHACLHAFVHFYFCHKEGKMVVDCLRGNYSNEIGYTLTTPTVHSLTGDFGPTDGGEDGIRRVIDFHQCNSLCSNLVAMGDILDNALRGKEMRGNTTARENIIPQVNEHQFLQGTFDVMTSSYHCSHLWRNEALYPTYYVHNELYRQEDAFILRQPNALTIGYLWQERALSERKKEAERDFFNS